MIDFLLICFIVLPILYYIGMYSYAFFRFLIFETVFDAVKDSSINKEKFKIHNYLLKGIALTMVAIFLYPLGYALIKGIASTSGLVEKFFNVCSILILESSIKALKIIPIEIGLLIVFYAIHYVFTKSLDKEKELMAEREKREKELTIKREAEIKNNKIQTANISLKKLNSIGLQEDLTNLIARQKLFTSTTIDKITPEIVKLPSTEHYDFACNQLSEIKQTMKDIVLQSRIAEDYDVIKNIAEDSESSIEDLMYILVNTLSTPVQISEKVSELMFLNNSDGFFNPLSKELNLNGIEIDLNDLSLNSKKATEYRAVFDEMIEELTKQFKISRKGFMGEQKVSEHLELYRDVIINLENVLFGVEGTTVEADNIIICENGVFCIETKNYGHSGETIVITKDGRWRRFQGRNEMEIGNVSAQHNRHIAIMQRTVNQELKKRGFENNYIFFEPIYVIANDEVQIKNDSNEITLLRTSSIYPYISKFQTRNLLSKELQEAIRDIILEYKQDLIKYPVSDYRNSFKDEFRKLLSDIENKDIPAKIYEGYVDHIEERYTIEINDVENERYIELK